MRRFSCLGVALLVAGCGTAPTAPPASTADFSLEFSAQSLSVQQGKTAVAQVTVVEAPPTLGSLQVTLWAPDGGAPSALVKGPSGFTRTLDASTVLDGLEPGAYEVSAPGFTLPGKVVQTPYQPSVTGSPANVVAAQQASVTVSYSKVAGAGRLYVLEESVGKLNGYNGAQLAVSGLQAPEAQVQLPSLPNQLLRDSVGNIWTLETNTQAAVAKGSGPYSKLPTRVFQAPQLAPPCSMAFNSLGNLFVTGSTGNFERYDIPNAPSPDGGLQTLLPAGHFVTTLPLYGSNEAAFDAKDRLWISGPDRLLRYDAAQLTLIESQWATPSAQVTSPAFSNPSGLAFDASGNLWVANLYGTPKTLLKSDASAVTGAGVIAATPSVTLERSASLPGPAPATLVFDPPPGLPLH
jgi:sugar lactone lactonase YvrE